MNMKRSLSLLLVLVLMLTMVPVSVRAEECAHENLRYGGNTTEFVCLDDTYHNQISHLYYTCEDCGARVWGETITQKEYHDIFYLDNFCTACGYRPGSTHIHDYKVSATDTKVEKVDSTYHNVVTTTYTKCSCGAEGESTVATVQEAHTLDSNRKCTRCDYQAPCTHENYSYEMETVGYERIDGLFHAWSYRSYEKCTDCGKILENYGTTSTQEYHKKVPGSSTTSLVPVDDTYHNVVTTTRMSCPCGYYSNSKSTVQEQHNVQGYGYDTGHPHQKYSVCTCGAHTPVKDQYQTVNGILQDANQCCICHGHKFGAAQETASGSWQKTCTNCGITQAAQNPTQPTVPETEPEETEPGETLPEEIHEHEFVYGSATAEHPHFTLGYCSCGVGSTSREYHFACCQCTGNHSWGYPVRLPDGSFKMICTRCDKIQTVTPSEGVETYYKLIDMIKFRRGAAEEYQVDHEIDSAACAIWKTIAEQATDKLMDEDFVRTTETLNTFGDISGSLVGMFTEESWNQQQIDFWKSLLIQMLQAQKTGEENGSGMITTPEGLIEVEYADDILSGVFDAVENMSNEKYDTLMESAGKLRDDIQIFQSRATHIEMYIENPKYKKLFNKWTDTLEDANAQKTAAKAAHGLGIFMDALSIVTEGNDKQKEVNQYNQALADLSENTENLRILGSIIATAEATGNLNLANAAYELRDDLADEMVETTNMLLSSAGAFFQGSAEGGLEVAVDKLVDSLTGVYSGALTVLELGATGLSSLLDWNDAYDAAQKLMTINHMDATMNIFDLLKEGDDPYMAELWGMLQAEGCAQAQIFLSEWEDGTGLRSTDLGIDDGGLFGKSELPKVINELNVERDYYITALKLPLEKSK